MAEFVGLRVRVDLSDEQVVEGMIEAVAQEANLILLSNAIVRTNPQTLQGTKFTRLELSGEQISSIDLLEDSSTTLETFTVAPLQLQQARGTNVTMRKASRASVPPPTVPSSIPAAPPKILSRKDKQQSQQRSPQRAPYTDWSKDDVKTIKSKEFDFQANLDLFDKEKIFSEIRASDDVRPEDRLVSHNLAQRKLRHDENVLDNRRPTSDEADEDRIVFSSSPTSKHPVGKIQSRSPSAKSTVIELSSSLVEAIEQQLIYSGSITVDQMIENCGRSLTEFLYQRVADVLVRAPELSIVLYISADRLGAYALCAGRSLCNRGSQVVAFISGDLQQRAPAYFNQSIRAFQACGGALVNKLPSAASLLVTSVSTMSSTPFRCPICSLTKGNTDATWTVRFGLPSDFSPTSFSILCDAGWPALLVEQLLQSNDCSLGRPYTNLFGFSSFVEL